MKGLFATGWSECYHFLDCHLPEDKENHSYSYNYHRLLPNRDSGLWKSNIATINSCHQGGSPKNQYHKLFIFFLLDLLLVFPIGQTQWIGMQVTPIEISITFCCLMNQKLGIYRTSDNSQSQSHCSSSCKICSQFHDILEADSWLTRTC